MDLSKFYKIDNEKPLDNLVTNGGFCGIFRTIGCIGDSLSSGEFESLSDEGILGWHDFYEYSWGQFLARDAGCKVYNFSKGGMTAKEFYNTYSKLCGVWDNPCQAYIIALGVNDLNPKNDIELGDISDVGQGGSENFVRAYSNIILSLKRRQPKAKFFLMTIPRGYKDDKNQIKMRDKHAEIIREIAEKFKHTYVLDFRKYAPVYDEKFRENFFLAGHMNPMGYRLTALMIESYIDYIIRNNPDDFKQTGFIGTPFHNCKEPW